jgi:phosphoglycolate phosphatase
MKYQAVMFDLDGTLADTLADIAAAGNHVLTQLGRPALEQARYRYLAGQGLEWLVAEVLGTPERGEIERGAAMFRAHYEAHGHAQTKLYPGIADLLDALTSRAIRLAVLSNKLHALTQQVVRDRFSRWNFAAVAGEKTGVPLKPDPTGALAMVSELGIPPDQWAYVGDTRVDMLTARAAGLFAVGVTWGFREEAELRRHGAQAIIHHPMELLDLL